LKIHVEVMVEDIFNCGGTLDKFVGDEIMALFGAPIAIPDAEFKAVSCALAMMASLEKFNTAQKMDQEIRQEEARKEGRKLKHFHPLEIGIGINSGTVVAGYVGSSKSLSYTVMGDPVNTANRFCSAAGAGEIIIGRAVYDVVKDRFDIEDRGFHKLKGKSAEQHLFRVIGFKEPSTLASHAPPLGAEVKMPVSSVGLDGEFSAAITGDSEEQVRNSHDISSTIPANAHVPAVGRPSSRSIAQDSNSGGGEQ
ncbi:MAG: adenylate/guanylate cyclase domain-containing protein, partial [Myxococcota bacterium]